MNCTPAQQHASFRDAAHLLAGRLHRYASLMTSGRHSGAASNCVCIPPARSRRSHGWRRCPAAGCWRPPTRMATWSPRTCAPSAAAPQVSIRTPLRWWAPDNYGKLTCEICTAHRSCPGPGEAFPTDCVSLESQHLLAYLEAMHLRRPYVQLCMRHAARATAALSI